MSFWPLVAAIALGVVLGKLVWVILDVLADHVR